ncbi:hypothetical protein F5B19DRAFT_457241 [Rostrohypoxylon terebratum]|nr:hypothetical protein F5B19DRAFT_457241 [Rostrohypoxylon terebratum]
MLRLDGSSSPIPLCAPFTSRDHVVPRLISEGFNVLRYDPPDHGASTGASNVPEDLSVTTFRSLAEDVRELLNNLVITQLDSRHARTLV